MFKANASTPDVQVRVKYGNAPKDALFTVSDFVAEELSFVDADPTNLLDPAWTFNSNQNTSKDGNQLTITRSATDVKFTLGTRTSEGWSQKALINPHVALESGKKYHIALTLSSSNAITGGDSIEFGAGPQSGDYKGIGEIYGYQIAEANTPVTLESTKVLDANYTNWMFCLKMGSIPNGTVITVTSIVVEEMPDAGETETTGYAVTPKGIGQSYDGTGYSELYVENNILVYDIKSLDHTKDYYNKFFLSDVVLEGGSKYIFELVVKSDVVLNASLILNVSGKWDPRATQAVEIGTEYSKITLESPLMAADLKFELLLQDLHQNTEVEHAKMEFQSIQIYQVTPLA